MNTLISPSIVTDTDWGRMGPELIKNLGQTLYMVAIAMVVAGFVGLVLGLALYVTRQGNLYENKYLHTALNIFVNVVRPIPFIIFIVAIIPLTRAVVGTTLGQDAAAFSMSLMAIFACSRLVEQNLVSLDPGVIEAARAMGASKFRVITTVIIPEALGPLILAYTFLFIGVVDMSAMVGAIGGGGLGDFALRHGYRQYNWEITVVTVLVIVAIVQVAQFFGNWLSRKVMHR